VLAATTEFQDAFGAEPPGIEGGSAVTSMMSRLTEEEAIPYLSKLGLLSRRDLMRGDVHVEDASRRNRNLKVMSTRGPSFVLKQPDASDRSTLESISREARMYGLFGNGTITAIRRLVPRFHHYDEKDRVLVLELIPSATPLGQYLDLQGGTPQPEVAAALGRAIAAMQRSPLLGHSKAEAPWALRFTFPGPELLRTASLGQLDVVRIVQQDADAWNIVRSLRLEYAGDCLVHGDLRWDNVLMRPRLQHPHVRLWIIDWELAHAGDPAWDVGSLFAAFLARCVCFMQPGNEINAHSLKTAFANQLPAAQAEIGRFWKAYVTDATVARTNSGSFLQRATLFCGARLLQMAFEWSPGAAIAPIAACFLQLGLNLLRRPAEAPRVVFRLSSLHA
jgi:hypothetical protein